MTQNRLAGSHPGIGRVGGVTPRIFLSSRISAASWSHCGGFSSLLGHSVFLRTVSFAGEGGVVWPRGASSARSGGAIGAIDK